MNELRYESSAVVIQKERSNVWNLGSKALPLVGAVGVLLYGAGFIATNASLAAWLIFDPDPLRSSSVLTGLLFISYLLCASVPSRAYIVGMKHSGLVPRYPRAAGVIMASLTGLSLVWLYVSAFSAADNQDIGRFLQSKNFVLIVVAFSLAFWAASAIGGIRYLLKDAPTHVRVQKVGLGCACLFLLIHLFGFVYLVVPQYLGGGSPIQKDVWFTKDAAQALEGYGLIPKNIKSTDALIEVPKLWVLYSRGDLFVFCDAKTCTRAIQVSKEWVKSESWPMLARR